MRLRRYIGIVCLTSGGLFHVEAMAAAVPAYNGKMNNAVGGVIGNKMGGWGFAPNDPRYAPTMAGVGAGLELAAGAAAVAAGTATWPAVLIGAGVAGLVAGGIALAQGGGLNWIFNPDGTISSTGSTASSGPATGPYAAMVPGGFYYQTQYSGKTWRAGGSGGPANSLFQALYGGDPIYTMSMDRSEPEGDNYFVYKSDYQNGSGVWGVITASRFGNAVMGCPAGQMSTNGVCGPATGYVAPVSDVDHVTPAVAIAAVPTGDMGAPIGDEMLAAAANSAWKAMPVGTPNAVPWSASDPITPADAGAWKAQNPSAVPDVGSALAPVSPAGGSSVPMPLTGTVPDPVTGVGPAPGPAPTPGTGTPANLGPDPNIPPPLLEATPTAFEILSPVLNLMPTLKNFAVPSHSAACPTPSFVALGNTYVLESHCGLLEGNRGLIEAAMLLCWTLASVFIVLRA